MRFNKKVWNADENEGRAASPELKPLRLPRTRVPPAIRPVLEQKGKTRKK